MTIHAAVPVEDRRKRAAPRQAQKGVERTEFEALHLSNPLGLLARTLLWADAEAMLEETGGPACGWNRQFAEQHVTEATMALLLDRRFPGFVEAGNALLRAAKGRELTRSERIEFKAYRYIWSGFHDRNEKKAEDRFGPGIGKRYWRRNKRMQNKMREVQNLLTTYGPGLFFDYDITDPTKVPQALTRG